MASFNTRKTITKDGKEKKSYRVQYVTLEGQRKGRQFKVRKKALEFLKAIDDIQIGDAFLYIRPCHKRFTEDCILTFDNAINFQGFPHLPGTVTE